MFYNKRIFHDSTLTLYPNLYYQMFDLQSDFNVHQTLTLCLVYVYCKLNPHFMAILQRGFFAEGDLNNEKFQKEVNPFFKHHHHHVVPPARISLTLSRHFSLLFIASGRSSGLHPISSKSCYMYIQASRPAFVRPYEGSIGVHHL